MTDNNALPRVRNAGNRPAGNQIASDEAIHSAPAAWIASLALAMTSEAVYPADLHRRGEAIMRQHKFGSSGPQVPVIGQGTWYIDRGDRAGAVAALRRGIELGMTHIDTAEM
jgi:hypothetical protein